MKQDSVTTLEDFALEEVHSAMGGMMYSIGRQMQDAGLLGNAEVAAVVSGELQRVLANAAGDPEAFSIQPEWLTSGNCLNA